MDKTSAVANAASRGSAADAILDAAEALFGRHGIDGVSLRQIATTAGSANNSAVQYHFGSKEGLIRAIFDRRMASLEIARSEHLAAARSADQDAEAASLLRALLLPIAEERDSAGRCSFAAFLLGLRLFGDIRQWNRYTETAHVTREIDSSLRAAVDWLSAEEFSVRLLGAVAVFLIAVVDWDRGATPGGPHCPEARDAHLQRAVAFAAAGLLAPAPDD
ncbi:TetR/AcrR family transcriptional regulator [Mangrovimicrobium sediminis]|uniref:TetR/AcrR family transcriptional regulator n=1 Tax=Mangrovimicrobium sediminis TaxID=2562682 RepID=A0A4Z0M8V1_9GAMM|nr:TetR/AcrR family transcriptional regulator [Haliea sp. SAOS-164]TGD76133.1 TetR/AcrR family transcriptional regulator [Haliea sp. SAOS-164]